MLFFLLPSSVRGALCQLWGSVYRTFLMACASPPRLPLRQSKATGHYPFSRPRVCWPDRHKLVVLCVCTTGYSSELQSRLLTSVTWLISDKGLMAQSSFLPLASCNHQHFILSDAPVLVLLRPDCILESSEELFKKNTCFLSPSRYIL